MVDDQVDFLPLVATWLRMLRGIVTVEIAASAAEGLALLERLQPHLVLSDVGMPEMNGFEFTRRLKASPAPPMVVLMTGLASHRASEEANAAGADCYLEKSVLHKSLPQFLIERFGVGHPPPG